MALSYEEYKKQVQLATQPKVASENEEFQSPLLKDFATSYPLSKIQSQAQPEPVTTWVDDNALYDFIGNTLWGGLEAFYVPTVLDIASDVREEGLLGVKDISAQFGSQDWKDESWAGRAGYMLGTGLGALFGVHVHHQRDLRAGPVPELETLSTNATVAP